MPGDHILDRVDRVLDLGWLREEVAECYCADNGRLGISPEMAIRLSQAFGGSPESWLQQQMQYDLWQTQTNRDKIAVRRFVTA